jgi:hypothetical protein
MKFLIIAIGLNGCSSSFPCIYRKIKKALMQLKASQRYATAGSEVANRMGLKTLEEQIQLAYTPPGLSDSHHAARASESEGEGCSSYVCLGCIKSIGPQHKELKWLPLPRKTKPGPDDYGVTARTNVNDAHLGTILRPMVDMPIQNFIFDCLHCKLRIVAQIFKWTATRNINDEKLEKVRPNIPCIQ